MTDTVAAPPVTAAPGAPGHAPGWGPPGPEHRAPHVPAQRPAGDPGGLGAGPYANPAPGPGLPPAPPPRPAPRRRPDRLPPTGRVLAIAAAFGLVFSIAMQGSANAVGGTVVVTGAVLVVLTSGRVRNRQVIVLAGMAAVFGVLLMVRRSGWLVPADLVLAVVTLVVAASYASGGDVVAASGRTVCRRAATAVLNVVLAPSYLFGAVAASLPARDAQRRARAIAIGRGIGLALPLLLVLGVLLASADAVFGSLFQMPVDGDSFVRHVLLFIVGVLVASYLLVEVATPKVPEVRAARQPLGSTEAFVVLTGLVLLYAVFALVQVVVALGGEGYVQATAGVTYADYARQGFFQLLAVAALTFVALASLRAWTRRETRREERWFTGLAELAILLTLVIVWVAISKLGLYDQAYGWTMLRYFCTWVAWWLGVVFVIAGIALAGVGRQRSWLTVAVLASATVAFVGFNAVDPEAIVAQRNVDRAAAGQLFDAEHLASLSDDAVPVIVASLPSLSEVDREHLLRELCAIPVERGTRRPTRAELAAEHTGLSYNTSAAAADAALAEVCG